MSYQRIIDTSTFSSARLDRLPPPAADRKDTTPVYEYSAELELALNVALATGRPLLLRGDPGSGKSTMGQHLAWKMRWRYYEHIITSGTHARDLLWTFDALARLRDAQGGASTEPARYVRPGPLWWALDPRSAPRRGADEQEFARLDEPPTSREGPKRVEDPSPYQMGSDARAVVLLDEIDKADPDLPNNLLAVLGNRRFAVSDLGDVVVEQSAAAPVIIVTSNRERDLPDAFLRRCVVHELKTPDEARMRVIARAHFPSPDPSKVTPAESSAASTAAAEPIPSDELIAAVHRRLTELAERAERRRLKRPSTAELIDALRACVGLGITGDQHPTWLAVTRATLWKVDAPSGDPGEEVR